jgi:flagellar hook-basal body complex protein FliE
MQIPAINPAAISAISPAAIPAIAGIGAAQKTSASSSTGQITQSFESMLNSLNQSQANSDNLVQQLSQGGNVDLHTVMIGMEENDVNFNVALSMRDKLVDAYHEVMRMQV